MDRIKIFLKLGIRKLVSRFKFTIVIKLLLHRVIGQMNVPIWDVLEGELSAACPEVALSVPVTLKVAANGAHHGEAPDVKLPILVEQWFFNILLDYVTSFEAIHICIANQVFDLIKVFRHLDTTASVSVLTGLDDPQLLAKSRNFIKYRLLRVILGVLVQLFKFMELWIVHALFDVEL